MKLTAKYYISDKLWHVGVDRTLRSYNNICFFSKYCNLTNVNSFADVSEETLINYAVGLSKVMKFTAKMAYSKCVTIIDLIKRGADK